MVFHFLFQDDPRKVGYGIFVGLINDKWHITFKGCAKFYDDVINGRPTSHAFQKEAGMLNAELKGICEEGILKVNRKYKKSKKEFEKRVLEAEKELNPCNNDIKPDKVNQ